VIDEEFTRAVGRAVRSLGPRLRDPLMLAASGEYSMEDIAAMLGRPVGTVKWRIAEARRLMREKLERMTERPR
jgi:RNA polymerase sigma-70 factor (ECF subfamily)